MEVAGTLHGEGSLSVRQLDEVGTFPVRLAIFVGISSPTRRQDAIEAFFVFDQIQANILELFVC